MYLWPKFGHLYSFILILFKSLSPKCRLEHVKHLLPRDEAVAVQVVDVETILDVLGIVA
jgi:hypothetical protein